MTGALEVRTADPTMAARQPLQPLWELDPNGAFDVRGSPMPADLEDRYGGPITVPLRGDRPTVIANFVSTLDGIVAMGTGALTGGGLISGFNEPDRFVMGLLRALADVVVIGAGTLRGSSRHRWTSEHVHPASAASFAAWRSSMGLSPVPTTHVVTARGEIPLDHPGLADAAIPAVVATTQAGAARLARRKLADHIVVRVVDDEPARAVHDILRFASEDGARLVLTEGGPHLLGSFVDGDRLDELFLTVSPQLVGRGAPERLGLVEGMTLPPRDGHWQELVSVRRASDHLFLRYRRQPGASTSDA